MPTSAKKTTARRTSTQRTKSGKGPIAELRNVSVVDDGWDALSKIDFQISSGEIVTLVGPNGSGKTTLLRVLIGAVQPTTGSTHRKGATRIGYVPQRLHLDPALPITVERFIGLPGRKSNEEVMEALEALDATHLAKRAMAELSGGEFQRVLFARAISMRPQLLIFDEATQGLDQPGSAAFYRRVAAARDKLGCAVIMASHELHVVMAASDRVVCLNTHICCQGTPAQVSHSPEYVALFGTATADALAIYQHKHDHNHDNDDAQMRIPAEK